MYHAYARLLKLSEIDLSREKKNKKQKKNVGVMYWCVFKLVDLELIMVIHDAVYSVLPSFQRVDTLYVCREGRGG